MLVGLACEENNGASLGAAHAVHDGLYVEMAICQCRVAALLMYLICCLQVHNKRRRTDGYRRWAEYQNRSEQNWTQRKQGPIQPTSAQTVTQNGR